MLILEETKGQIFFSKGFGKPWEAIDLSDIILDNKQIKIVRIVKNPYNAKELFAITDKPIILHTTNYGGSWKSIELPEVLPIKEAASKNYINNEFLSNTQNNTFPVQFHPNKESEYIFAGKCQLKLSENDNDQHCVRQFYYGKNKLLEIEPLLKARGCLFTIPKSKNDTVICLTNSGSITGSKTLFKKPTKDKNDNDKDNDKDNDIDRYRDILQDKKILQIYYFHNLFIGISLNSISLSTDGLIWTTENFKFKVPNRFAMNLVAGAYKNTLMLTVKSNNQVGAFYKISLNLARSEITIGESLSHIHRDITGLIDVDKVEHVEGVLLANIMMNGDDVIKGNYKDIELKSLITFDNGENWKPLKDIGHDSRTVNLHSIIRKSISRNYARSEYRSPYTPEVLIGVGNSGDFLDNYSNGDTWLSLDQGKSWNKTLQGPHVFQFANLGSLIIAIPDIKNKALEDLRYSFDFGHSWKTHNFAGKSELNNARFVDCITVPNSNKGELVLIAEDDQRTKFETLNLDFTNVFKELKVCDKSKDFDTIFLSDLDKEFCFMGFKQTFKRRKPDVLCSVSEEVTEVNKEPCYCTQSDYECAVDFYADVNGNCITNNTELSGHHLSAKYCDGKTKLYFKPSGYMIKDGNECFADKHMGLRIDDRIEVPCENYENDDDDDNDNYNDKNSKVKLGKKLKATKNATSDYVSSYDFQFDGSVIQFEYLLPSKNKKGYSGDENVIVLTSNNKAYFSYNQGMQWQDIYPNEDNDKIIGYHVNVQKGWISLVSSSGKVIYSHNNGYTWRTFHSPISSFTSTQNLKIEFNIQERSWIIFTAKVNDDRIVSYISTDMGNKWSVLQDNVMTSCLFAVNYLNVKTNQVNKNLIFCPHYSSGASGASGTTRTASLKSSTDFFATQKNVLPNLQSFWADHKNVLIGTTFSGSEFQLFTSYDGSDWKRKLLTHSLNVTDGQTLLFDIKTKSTLPEKLPQKELEFYVMDKHVERLDVKFGEIYKSDSNGDKFILAQTHVNYEDSKIDYQVIDPRLKGIILANIVLNANTFTHNTDNRNKITNKIIQSQISFDDGSLWNYIAPPKHDINKKKYQCSGKTSKECSLHLHGKTSILKDTKTSQPAIGLVVANGNVGDALSDYNSSDTFFSVDAGISWKEIKKGPHKSVFGNHGTMIVLVDTKNPTNKIDYSYDYGQSWESFNFTDRLVAVNDISTVQSRKYTTFILHGTKTQQSATLFRVSFDGDKLPSCYKYKNYDKSDFEIVNLRHPQIKNQECLFGKRLQIIRRKPKSICVVKDEQMNEKEEELVLGEQCQCTKFDYECDTNYFKTSKGKCQIFADLEDKIKAEYSKSCREMVDSVVEYELPSGYRKTSITSCINGVELNKPLLKACEGKQNEFDDVHVGGLRGFKFFMLVVIIIFGAVAIGYIGIKYLYITKANLGRIRLAGGDYDDIGYDDDGLVFNDDTFYLRPNINSFGQLVKYEAVSLLRAVYGVGRTTVDMVVELLKEPGNRQKRAASIRLDDRTRYKVGNTRAGGIGQRNRSTFRDYEDQDAVALLQGSVDEWKFSLGKKK